MLNLRPYQIESIESLRQGFREGHKRQILAASTGAGKSVIMKAMIQHSVEKGKRVLFLCERRILVEQFSRHLDEIEVDHGVHMYKHWRKRSSAMVQIASVQTLEKTKLWPAADIVFVDEIHACMRKSLRRFMENHPDIKVCGSTATPFHPEIPKYFTSVTSVITMDQLVKDGNLVPMKIFSAQEVNTEGLKVTAGEWQKDELDKRGQQIVGDIVAEYIKLSFDIFGEPRKTICFSCGVAHGTDLVNRFNEAGINAIQISYKDSDEFKEAVLEEFARPDTDIKVLISTSILERGFDQTDVEHIILAKPLRKSFSSHVQMIGRGVRTHEGKKICVIQDHAGNWLRFKDDWNDLYHNGIKELSSNVDFKPRKEPTKQEKEAAKCPKCSHIWPARSDICAHCGFVREKKNAVLVQPGQLVELGQTLKVNSDEKKSFYHQLLYYCDMRGYADGWAYHKYLKRFGVAPRWPKAKSPVTKEVMNWIKSQHIAYAKAKEKARV